MPLAHIQRGEAETRARTTRALAAATLLTVKASRKGGFAIPFGAIAQHPGPWTWLRETKETWVPTGVKVTPQPGAEPVETVEGCHLDAAAVRRLGQAAQAGR